jgi:hypothetical protein
MNILVTGGPAKSAAGRRRIIDLQRRWTPTKSVSIVKRSRAGPVKYLIGDIQDLGQVAR